MGFRVCEWCPSLAAMWITWRDDPNDARGESRPVCIDHAQFLKDLLVRQGVKWGWHSIEDGSWMWSPSGKVEPANLEGSDG